MDQMRPLTGNEFFGFYRRTEFVKDDDGLNKSLKIWLDQMYLWNSIHHTQQLLLTEP